MQEIEKQLTIIFSEYTKEVNEISNDVMKKAARDVAKTLKSTSPKDEGDYARNWSMKTEKLAAGSSAFLVYNKDYGWKTHLLENGHVIKNKKGDFGRAPAHPHIGPARDKAEQKIIAELEKKL